MVFFYSGYVITHPLAISVLMDIRSLHGTPSYGRTCVNQIFGFKGL